MNTLIEVRDLAKTFTLHQQHGVSLQVLRGLSFTVSAGECLVLHGQSGAGKSTLLRTLYGNYLPAGGSIRIRHAGDWLELVGAEPRQVLAVRRQTLGYVSQFLRVIPRVPALEVVMEPALARGWSRADAEARAKALLTRLNISERLWQLAPGTFSGGEQQRVQLARVLCQVWVPVLDGVPRFLFLDEPVSSLDIRHQLLIMDVARRYADAGGGVVVVLHDLNLASMYADHIVALRDGRVAGAGAPQSVLTDALLARVFDCPLRVGAMPSRAIPFVLPQSVQSSAPSVPASKVA